MTPGFIKAVKALQKYVNTERPEYANVVEYIAAQWALESGWGTSTLARAFNNFGGMKYRDELADICEPTPYRDWEKVDDSYCMVDKPENYPRLYFAFLDRSIYRGLEKHLGSGKDFIEFLVCKGYVGSMEGGVEKYWPTIHSITQRHQLKLLFEESEAPSWLNTTYYGG